MFGTLRWRLTVRYGLMAGLLAILGLFLIWPIVMTVRGGFTDPATGGLTFRYFIGRDLGVLRDPLYLAGLRNSLLIAVATTLTCLVLALPLAVISTRFQFPGKALLTSLVMVPLILPPFVGAIGMRAILGRAGALNALLAHVGLTDPQGLGIDFLGGAIPGGRLAGIIFIEALALYPILYLNIAAALANLDPALEEAAQNLGAGRMRRFTRITLPLILPGIFAGATIVFIWSFTELGTPLMFDFSQVTSVQVFWGVQEVATNPRPYALVVVMLSAALSMYLLGKFVLGGRAYAMQSKASIAAQPRVLRGWPAAAAVGCFVGVTLLAVLPHLGVILSSFSRNGSWYRTILPASFTGEHYARALSHPMAIDSIRNSLLYASGAMVLCLFMGMAIAYLTVRAKVRGAWALDALAMLPLAVPGLVMAFGYVAMSLRWPFPQLSEFFTNHGWPGVAGLFQITGLNPNPTAILVVAYAVRRLPYVVRSAAAGLQQTPVELEEAAMNLGATPLTALRRIVVPLIMANLIAGGILAFSFAMLEVSDSLILAQKQSYFPITKAIFEFYNRLGDGPYIASAMGVWGMALLTVTLVGAGLLMGRKMGAIFRA